MGLALAGRVHSAWAPGQFRAMMCIGISEREFMRGPPAATELPTRRRIRAPRMTAGDVVAGPPFLTARVRAGGLPTPCWPCLIAGQQPLRAVWLSDGIAGR